MNDIIQINEKNYSVYSFHGKVLENRLETRSETYISGYGSRGNMSISGDTIHYEHTKVYLQAENGEQEMFSIPNFHLDAIKGHDIIAVSLIDDNQKNELVAFINVTLSRVQCFECSLDGSLNTDIIVPADTGCLPFFIMIACIAIGVFYSWQLGLITVLIVTVLDYITLRDRRITESRNLTRQRVQSLEKTKEDIINILQKRHHILQPRHYLVEQAIVRLTNKRTPTKHS